MDTVRAAFESRAGEAARTLLRNQGYDGGWGLTLTSVSSIVNTSEVLPILRAAGIAGQPVRQGLGFPTGAIPEHSRPRPNPRVHRPQAAGPGVPDVGKTSGWQ